MQENHKRRGYDSAPQQGVLENQWKPRKLGEHTGGPSRIAQTHMKGMVTIKLRPGLTEK